MLKRCSLKVSWVSSKVFTLFLCKLCSLVVCVRIDTYYSPTPTHKPVTLESSWLSRVCPHTWVEEGIFAYLCVSGFVSIQAALPKRCCFNISLYLPHGRNIRVQQAQFWEGKSPQRRYLSCNLPATLDSWPPPGIWNDDVICCFRAKYPTLSLAPSALAFTTLKLSLKHSKNRNNFRSRLWLEENGRFLSLPKVLPVATPMEKFPSNLLCLCESPVIHKPHIRQCSWVSDISQNCVWSQKRHRVT